MSSDRGARAEAELLERLADLALVEPASVLRGCDAAGAARLRGALLEDLEQALAEADRAVAALAAEVEPARAATERQRRAGRLARAARIARAAAAVAEVMAGCRTERAG